ncbi:MAG: hypothetical protein K9G40_12640 [Crocinitomicaceae bacterium]|nr:hypothetical protein [Crocinitomicaceae bacterium]
MKKNSLSFMLSIFFFSVSFVSLSQVNEELSTNSTNQSDSKQVNKQDQLDNLFLAFDRFTANERKLSIISERMSSLPAEELEKPEIKELIQKYSQEKNNAERKIFSIEHYFKSVGSTIEIPQNDFNAFSESLKIRIANDSVYKISL